VKLTVASLMKMGWFVSHTELSPICRQAHSNLATSENLFFGGVASPKSFSLSIRPRLVPPAGMGHFLRARQVRTPRKQGSWFQKKV
jgi:hypothetical protein